jgi:hypothetical protein
MALQPVQGGREPLGQFDGYFLDTQSFLGGEVCTFIAVPSASNPGPADSADGYLYGGTTIPAVTKSQLSNSTTLAGPYMLADDGTASYAGTVSTGYGTLFGTVVGGTVGQTQIGSGTVLGPPTQTGSSRITCWDKPGLYKVSLDACDPTAATGLQPTNSTLTTGAKLYAMASGAAHPGFLTPAVASTVVGGSGGTTGQVLARFVEFETNRSLVTTPNRLVAALNSPSANPAVSLTQKVQFAVFSFLPESTLVA